MACDISRACRPTCVSPISPSISARGTSAATESMTTRSSARRADQHVGDLQRLLAGVGLGHEQLVDVHAELAGVRGVEGVLGVDERRDAALPLGLGDDVQADGGLARALGAEDLDDATAGDAADAERDVEGERAGRDDARSRPHGCSPSCMTAPLPNCFSICCSVTSSILSRSIRESSFSPRAHRATVPANSLSDERTLGGWYDIGYTPVIWRPDPFGSRDGEHRTRTDVRPQASRRNGSYPVRGCSASGLVAGRPGPAGTLSNSTARTTSNGTGSIRVSSKAAGRRAGGSQRPTVRCGWNARTSGGNAGAKAASSARARGRPSAGTVVQARPQHPRAGRRREGTERRRAWSGTARPSPPPPRRPPRPPHLLGAHRAQEPDRDVEVLRRHHDV